ALDRYCLCESYARATERAALAGARWLGRADQEAAERDSSEAMRSALEHLPIDGHVVIGEPASLQTLPDMYMRKLAVGPLARAAIDLRRPVAENIGGIAEAFGRSVNDVTTIVLDRPRHHDLIEEIRAAGARIKLIQDGDVTASISA